MAESLSSPRPAARTVLPAGLLALLLLLYLPGLIRGAVPYLRDLLSHDLGWRVAWAAQVHNGCLPLWQPLTTGGMPLLADPNTQALYPSTLLFLVLDPARALALHLLLHQLLLAIGGVLLLRRLGHDTRSALAGATFLAAGGMAFSQLVFPNALATLAWAPWLAWSAAAMPADRAARHRRTVLGGLIGALMLLAGEPAVAALAWIFWLTTLVTSPAPADRRQRAAVGLVTPLLALLLAAPLVVPAAAAFVVSRRHVLGLPPGSFAADAFVPRRWPELLLPHLYGRPGWLAPDGFWAAPSFPWLRYELNLHVGTLALVLVGLTARRRGVRTWLLLAAATTAVAALPGVLAVAAARVPGIGAFRYSVKLLVLAHLALTPVVAAGFATALRRPRALRRWAGVVAVPVAGVLALGASPSTLENLLARVLPASRANLALPGVAGHVAATVRRDALAQVLPLAAVAAPGSLLLPALAVQLVVEGHSTLRWDDWAWYRRELPLARDLGDDRRLVALVGVDTRHLRTAATDEPSPRYTARVARRQLWQLYGELDGVSYRGTVAPDGMEPWWVAECAARLRGAPEESLAHAARQLGAAWVLRRSRLPDGPDVVGVTRLEVAGDTLYLHHLAAPTPAAWLARRVITEPWREAGWQRLTDQVTKPGRDAVMVGSRSGDMVLGGGTATVAARTPGRWSVQLDSAGPGLLVVDSAFSPAWRATVDGSPAELQVVNLWQIGVRVPAGRHRVALAVSTAGFRDGLLLAAAGLLLSLLLVGRRATAPRRSPSDGAAPTHRATPPAP